MKTKLHLTILLAIFCLSINAQPSNDGCLNAINLTSDTACNYTSGSNSGATGSFGPTLDCGTGNNALDVWYKFTALQTSHTVKVQSGTGFDANVNVREGVCPGFTFNFTCVNSTFIGGIEIINLTGLTIGNEYLIRVYGSNGTGGNFQICITHTVTTGINQWALLNPFLIYPNPFSKQTTLQTDKFLKDATLTVYNLYGQQVKQIKNISGQTVTLHRDNLSSGLYFIHLTQDSKVISTDKLVITD